MATNGDSGAAPTDVFRHVVCGIDGSEEGLVAARVAGRVADPDGALALVAAADPAIAAQAGWAAAAVDRHLREETEAALTDARAAVEGFPSVESEVVAGRATDSLLAALARRGATLAVVGTHGAGRARGIALGSVSTRLLHDAPCSVLVARAPAVELERWPRSIVLGLDGSVPSARAAAAAWALAERLGADVRAIAGAGADAEEVRRIAPEAELHEAGAVDALVVASEHADLVVVGSRGVTGVRALGSVSERVGHQARSSVLVVREG